MLHNEALNEDAQITAWIQWEGLTNSQTFLDGQFPPPNVLRIRKIQADIHGFRNDIPFSNQIQMKWQQGNQNPHNSIYFFSLCKNKLCMIRLKFSSELLRICPRQIFFWNVFQHLQDLLNSMTNLGEKARHIFTFSKCKTTQLNNKHKLCGDMYTVQILRSDFIETPL